VTLFGLKSTVNGNVVFDFRKKIGYVYPYPEKRIPPFILVGYLPVFPPLSEGYSHAQ
jgi:hypothetical protein